MKNIPVLVFSLLAIILSGCSSSKLSNLDQTIKATESPVVLAFQKGQLQVIDVASGDLLSSCDEIKNDDKQREHACKSLNSVKILSDETMRIVKYEGSLCVSFIYGQRRVDYCSPPYPHAVIESLMN